MHREFTADFSTTVNKVCTHFPVSKFQILIVESADPDTKKLFSLVENILRHVIESECPVNVRWHLLDNLSYIRIVESSDPDIIKSLKLITDLTFAVCPM